MLGRGGSIWEDCRSMLGREVVYGKTVGRCWGGEVVSGETVG